MAQEGALTQRAGQRHRCRDGGVAEGGGVGSERGARAGAQEGAFTEAVAQRRGGWQRLGWQDGQEETTSQLAFGAREGVAVDRLGEQLHERANIRIRAVRSVASKFLLGIHSSDPFKSLSECDPCTLQAI